VKTFSKVVAVIILIILCVYIYSRFIEPNMLSVHYENISNKLISKDTEPIKILQFSDTHLSEYFDTVDLEKAVTKINDENPDIVIFSGDLIDDYRNYSYTNDISEVIEMLKKIKAPLGKYSVYGNHDYGGGAEKAYKEIMGKSDFINLVNDGIKLKKYNLNIIGLDDSFFGNVDTVKIEEKLDENYYNIVIGHEPDVVDSMLEYDIDLFLSGHSHGGQVQVPFLKTSIFPPLGEKYTRGVYEFENHRDTKLYVNIGLGTTQVPFRFMAVPELTVLILKNE